MWVIWTPRGRRGKGGRNRCDKMLCFQTNNPVLHKLQGNQDSAFSIVKEGKERGSQKIDLPLRHLEGLVIFSHTCHSALNLKESQSLTMMGVAGEGKGVDPE